MKKFFAIVLSVLCFIFTLALVACNGSGTDGSPETPPAPATESLTYEKVGDAYKMTGETANAPNIVIPSEYAGLPVTTIAESAFAYSRQASAIHAFSNSFA